MTHEGSASVSPRFAYGLISIATVAIWCVCAGVSVAEPSEAAEAPKVYQLKPGDSLRSLAARFLGGEEFLPELLAYNSISNPLELGDGAFIGIPGAEREAALKAIAEAREATRRAIAAASQTYAKDELKAAQEGIDAANAARRRARYAEASERAKLGTTKADLAKRLADQRAPVPEPGTLSAVFGNVKVAPSGSSVFVPAKAGSPLPVGSRVRTAPGARAEVRLPDGSTLQILANSVFRIEQSRLDRRDQRRDVQLDVIMGGILGKIPKRTHARSTYRLKSPEAAIAIRGTEVRVGNDESNVSRLSVLAGLAELSASGKTTPVPENSGSYSEAGKAPHKPVELLPAPDVLVPGSVERRTAQQQVPFEWTPLKTRKFGCYHLELSQDASFNTIVEDVLTKGATHVTRPLIDGEYFWRISTIDKKGLEGRVRDGKVVIRRRVAVAFEEADGSRFGDAPGEVSLGERILAVPASLDTSIVRMELSLDGVAFWTFWEPMGRFVPTRPGPVTLYARGIDALGNTGPVVQQLINVTPRVK